MRKVALQDVPANARRGGDVRVLLSPMTVGATSGFMAAAALGPADLIREHYHPYSEEFLYVVSGSVLLTLDGAETLEIGPGEAVMVPRNTRHRLENRGDVPAFAVFHNSPLAPRPDLGHVDTAPPAENVPDPQVGGPHASA